MDHSAVDLAFHQFGFRRNHSTVDAIGLVKFLVKKALSKSMVIAVNLDIRNVFNSMP